MFYWWTFVFLISFIIGIVNGGPIPEVDLDPPDNLSVAALESSGALPGVGNSAASLWHPPKDSSSFPQLNNGGNPEPEANSNLPLPKRKIPENRYGLTYFKVWTADLLDLLNEPQDSNPVVPIDLASPNFNLTIKPRHRARNFTFYAPKIFSYKYKSPEQVTRWKEEDPKHVPCSDEDCVSLVINLSLIHPNSVGYRTFLKVTIKLEDLEPFTITFSIDFNTFRYSTFAYDASTSQEVLETYLKRDLSSYIPEPFGSPEYTFTPPEVVFQRIGINIMELDFNSASLPIIRIVSPPKGDLPYEFKFGYLAYPEVSHKRFDCTAMLLDFHRSGGENSPSLEYVATFTHNQKETKKANHNLWYFWLPFSTLKKCKSPTLWVRCIEKRKGDLKNVSYTNVLASFQVIEPKQRDFQLEKVVLSKPDPVSGSFEVSTARYVPENVPPHEFLEFFWKDDVKVPVEALSKIFSVVYESNMNYWTFLSFKLTLKPGIEDISFFARTILLRKGEMPAKKSNTYECSLSDCLSYQLENILLPELEDHDNLPGRTLEFQFILSNGLKKASWSVFISLGTPKDAPTIPQTFEYLNALTDKIKKKEISKVVMDHMFEGIDEDSILMYFKRKYLRLLHTWDEPRNKHYFLKLHYFCSVFDDNIALTEEIESHFDLLSYKKFYKPRRNFLTHSYRSYSVSRHELNNFQSESYNDKEIIISDSIFTIFEICKETKKLFPAAVDEEEEEVTYRDARGTEQELTCGVGDRYIFPKDFATISWVNATTHETYNKKANEACKNDDKTIALNDSNETKKIYMPPTFIRKNICIGFLENQNEYESKFCKDIEKKCKAFFPKDSLKKYDETCLFTFKLMT